MTVESMSMIYESTYPKALPHEAFTDGYLACDKKLEQAKAIIKEMLPFMPKENIEGIYEIVESAEQFLREIKENDL